MCMTYSPPHSPRPWEGKELLSLVPSGGDKRLSLASFCVREVLAGDGGTDDMVSPYSWCGRFSGQPSTASL